MTQVSVQPSAQPAPPLHPDLQPPPQAVAMAQEVDEETRRRMQRIQDLLSRLIVAGTDLSIAVARLDCPSAATCPVVREAREIAKILGELRSLIRS